MLTIDQIKQICPRNKNVEQLTQSLNDVLPKYDINTRDRIAYFISQTIHESAQYTILVEGLNYSAQGLMKTWPKRFPSLAVATPYARNQEKIANKVYADRMGNGSESSGDGWKYRGRGAIMLTGKDNYSRFAKSIDKSLDETVAYCTTIEGSLAAGCWFWTVNKLNRFADSADFTGLTKAINGGIIGINERKEIYASAISALTNLA